MRYRKLGQSGIGVSVVGLGAWAIGGSMWGEAGEENDSIKAIQSAIDAGINLIDTAPGYGYGYSEKVVGKAVAGRRDKVVLATKCGLNWEMKKGQYFYDDSGFSVNRYLGSDGVRFEIEKSLRLLKTDYIDLYQTHWQDLSTDIAETMGALLELKKEGKIRAIGISNATLEHVEAYRKLGPVDSMQEKFNMLDQKIDETILPYCRKNTISMLSYSSLALGLLTGKVDRNRQFPEGDLRRENPLFSIKNRQIIADMLNGFTEFIEKYSVSLSQLVIAWTLSKPGITCSLCGARNPKQAIENARAGDILIDKKDLVLMNKTIADYVPRLLP